MHQGPIDRRTLLAGVASMAFVPVFARAAPTAIQRNPDDSLTGVAAPRRAGLAAGY